LASNNHVPVHAARDSNPTGECPYNLISHTKAIFIDRSELFVGSLNLDSRSIDLNAEMGLLIESEALVGMLLEDRHNTLATNVHRVLINEGRKPEWHCTADNQRVIETTEPLTGRWLRFKAWFLKIAPEDQL
jgi:putative cardiolipin synthase